MGSIRWNRLTWGNPDNWTLSGDGWDFHARCSGRLYEEWKASVVEEFLTPYLGPDVDAVEIGPGQGRWSEFIVRNSRTVALVDLSANCIDACRQRFADADPSKVSFYVNDGAPFPMGDSSVDLVWSFGTFVHIEIGEIDHYLGEIRRVLRPGGTFVIHHPGVGGEGHDGRVGHSTAAFSTADATSESMDALGAGLRSDVSAGQVATLIAQHDLVLTQQMSMWGLYGEYRLAFGDAISVGMRRSG